jgi:PAS domain S-box-containing protein
MKDERKTKGQLIKELADLRHQIDGLRKRELGLKQAVEALQQSEIRFKELADSLPQTFFEFDEESKFVFVNRNAFSMFGFSPEDFEKGLNAFQTIVPEDRDRAKGNIQRALRGEKVGPSAYTLLRKDGSTFPAIVYSGPVSKENRPVGLRGIVIDITERKQVEEALRDSEKRYRILADNAGDLIFTLDMGLRFTYVSPSVRRLLGYTAEELIDVGVREVLAPDSAELAFKAFAEEMALEASGAQDPSRERVMELKLVDKDKTTVWGEVKMSFLREADGRPVGVLGVTRDVTERKRTQQALRESEERLRALFDHAAAGMALVDTNGRVLATNQANCRFLGYTEEETVGMHFADFVHPEDRDADAALYESLLKGQRDSYVMDKRYIRRHGEIVWGRLSVSLVRGQNGQPQYTAVVCEDITDRKRAEEVIRESEARYRAMMEQSPDGIYLVDVETRQVMEANSAFQKMLDYTYSEIPGLSFPDFVVGNRDDLDRRFMDVLLGKGPFTFERQYRKKDGSLLDVWVSTRVISFGGRKAILVLAHDLTELTRARNALQESEARYRAVMEQSADGIYLVDVEIKQLLETNPALQKMLGYTGEEMQGLTPYDFTAAERENIDQRFWEITTGADFLGYERQFRRKDGTLLDAWVNANVIRFGGRNVACFLVREITERKRAEAERERIIGELQEALSRIKTLRGLIPICANCKKIRDDKGYWQQVETYVREHSEAEFSHGLCPECIEILFPELKGNGGESGVI